MQLLSTLLLLLLGVVAATSETAKLLVSKSVRENYLVNGRNATIDLKVYNIGEGYAHKISIDDSLSFGRFSVVEGTASHEWAELAPGSNLTHTFVVKPNITGRFLDLPAKVSYEYSDDGNVQAGTSSTLLYLYVLSEQEYISEYADHKEHWLKFLVLASVPILIPYVWHLQVEKSLRKL